YESQDGITQELELLVITDLVRKSIHRRSAAFGHVSRRGFQLTRARAVSQRSPKQLGISKMMPEPLFQGVDFQGFHDENPRPSAADHRTNHNLPPWPGLTAY